MSHDDKGGLLVGLFLLVLWGVIQVVAATWPYSLWVMLFLLFSTIAYFGITRRRNLWAAMCSASTEGAVRRLRGQCAAVCFVVGGIGIAVCVVSARSPHFIYYLSGTLPFVTAWFHLKKLETEPEEKSAGELKLFPGRSEERNTGKLETSGHTLAFYIYKASRNYLFQITVVSLTFAIANLYLSQIPTNQATLRELREYEERLARARAFFDALKLSLFRAVALLVALWCVGMTELRWSGRTRVVERSWSLLKPAMKTVEKGATLLAAAASFTFLGTGGHGVITSFSAHIKEAEETYTDFQRKVDEAADRLVAKELTARSWKEQPPALREGMEEAAKLMEQMEQHRDHLETAEARYKLGDASTPGLERLDAPPVTGRVPTNPEPPPDSLSVDSARSALEAVKQFNEQVKTYEESGEGGLKNELASKTIEALSPLNHVEEFVSHLGDFADHWPVVAEYGSTLASALNDWGFQKALREFKSWVAGGMLRGEVPDAEQVRAEAAVVTEKVEINWSRYTPEWLRERSAAMERNRGRLAKSDVALQASAREAQIRQAREASVTISKRLRQLGDMGRVLSDFKLEMLSGEMESARRQLLERAGYWSPLGELSRSQINELTTILKPLESDWQKETAWAADSYRVPALTLNESDSAAEQAERRFQAAAEGAAEIHSVPLESDGRKDTALRVRTYRVPMLPSYESASTEAGSLMLALRWLKEYGQERALWEIGKNYDGVGEMLLREKMGPAFAELSGLYEERLRAEEERRAEAKRERARAAEEAARARVFEQRREAERRERIRERADQGFVKYPERRDKQFGPGRAAPPSRLSLAPAS